MYMSQKIIRDFITPRAWPDERKSVSVICRIIYIEIDERPTGRAPDEFLLFRLEN